MTYYVKIRDFGVSSSAAVGTLKSAHEGQPSELSESEQSHRDSQVLSKQFSARVELSEALVVVAFIGSV